MVVLDFYSSFYVNVFRKNHFKSIDYVFVIEMIKK